MYIISTFSETEQQWQRRIACPSAAHALAAQNRIVTEMIGSPIRVRVRVARATEIEAMAFAIVNQQEQSK
jgi:hypothetical protein